MASLIQQILSDVSGRLDAELLPAAYQLASLRTEQVREELRALGLSSVDPEAGQLPAPEELEAAADELLRRAARTATIRGAVGGAGGALAIPPEVAASVVQTLRHAQRLLVLYGFVLESDQGQLMLIRALEAAYQLELPQQRAMSGVRVSDLPQVARQRVPDVQRTTAWVARTVAWRVARHVGGRLSRILPGVGAGVGAWDAQRSLREQDARMRPVLRRAWAGGLLLAADDIVDAEEIVEVGPVET